MKLVTRWDNIKPLDPKDRHIGDALPSIMTDIDRAKRDLAERLGKRVVHLFDVPIL
jgi:hypothetical protein